MDISIEQKQRTTQDLVKQLELDHRMGAPDAAIILTHLIESKVAFCGNIILPSFPQIATQLRRTPF